MTPTTELPPSNIVNYDGDTWKTMQMLKSSLTIMKERNLDGRFNEGIKKEKSLLDNYIKDYKQ